MAHISPSALSGLSSGTSSVTFSGNSAGAVMLGPTSPRQSGSFPLVDPTPTPDPSVTSDPSPAPTVTVTETVAPAGPSVVKLDEGQFLGLTTGLALLLLFVVAAVVSQLRRP